MTMIASFGGGTVSLMYSLIIDKGRIEVIAIINGILGSLVAITAGCFLYEGEHIVVNSKWPTILEGFISAWEALVIGAIGALIVCIVMPIFDKLGIDDPVGASSVHGVGGIWGI